MILFQIFRFLVVKNPYDLRSQIRFWIVPQKRSLLAEVSHDKAKMTERRETSAGFRRVSYHACAGVSLTTSDVFLTCDTTHRTGLPAKLQLKAGVYVVENSSQCETMPTTPQSRKFGESASTRTPIKPVGSGKDVRYLLRVLDFKGERC